MPDLLRRLGTVSDTPSAKIRRYSHELADWHRTLYGDTMQGLLQSVQLDAHGLVSHLPQYGMHGLALYRIVYVIVLSGQFERPDVGNGAVRHGNSG